LFTSRALVKRARRQRYEGVTKDPNLTFLLTSHQPPPLINQAHKFFFKTARTFAGIPPSFVTLLDKDATAFKAMLAVNQEALLGDDAQSELKAVLATLRELSANSTKEQCECATALIKSLPKYMTGLSDIKSPSDTVLLRPELVEKYPDAWSAAPSDDDVEKYSLFFKRDVVNQFAELIPGVAAHVHTALEAGVKELLAASTYGEFNIAAGKLYHLTDLVDNVSALGRFLRTFCLLFCLLCRFHVGQAIGRKAQMTLDADTGVRAIAGLRGVFSGELTKEEYMAKYKYLDDIETFDGDGGRGSKNDLKISWNTYVERFWLSKQWFSTVYEPFRALLTKQHCETTNDTENMWKILKGHRHLGGRAAISFGHVLENVIGDDKNPGSRMTSLSYQKRFDLRNIYAAKQSQGERRARDTISAALQEMLRVYAAGVRKGAKLPINDLGNGNFSIGAATSGFVFQPLTEVTSMKQVAAPDLKSIRGATLVSTLAPLAPPGARGSHSGSGRTQIGRSLAVTRASEVGDPLAWSSGDVVEELLMKLVEARKEPSYKELDPFLGAAKATLRSVLVHMNIDSLRALLEMAKAVDGTSDISLVEHNHNLRAALLKSWCLLKKSDFKAGAPSVAYIYVVMCTMSARALCDEYERVIVRGEQTSLAHGTPVSMTYRSMLVDAHDTAARCVALGKPDELVTVFYVGQEQRGKRSITLFRRVWEHGTTAGDANVREFAAFFGSGGHQVLYAPVGDVVVERRILCMLPGDSPHVSVAESTIFALLLYCSGSSFLFFNMSPPGEELRFLVSNHRGDAAKVFEVGEASIASCKKDKKTGIEAARLLTLDEAKPFMGAFLRRAMRTVHALLLYGHFRTAIGEVPTPCFKATKNFSFATCFDALVLSSSGFAAAPKRECKVSLWCNSCSCEYPGILCKHIIFLRLYSILELCRTSSWWDTEEQLYALLDRDRVLSPSTEAAAAVVPSKASWRAPASSVVLEADYLLAEIAHLTAVTAEDLAKGSEQARQMLDSVVKSLRTAVNPLRKGLQTASTSASASRSTRKFAPIARDMREVSRSQASAAPVMVSELPPAEALARSVTLRPLSEASGGRGDCAEARSGAPVNADANSSAFTLTVSSHAHTSLSSVARLLREAEALREPAEILRESAEAPRDEALQQPAESLRDEALRECGAGAPGGEDAAAPTYSDPAHDVGSAEAAGVASAEEVVASTSRKRRRSPLHASQIR
jgi:hypothetical protein